MTNRTRATILFIVASLGLAACGGNGDPQTTSEAADENVSAAGPTTTPASERWQYVAIGDSTHGDVALSFQAILEEELGVEVELIEWINPDLDSYEFGGERAADLVDRLRTDEDLRSDLREAEVITFVVPLGQYIDLCPFDADTYEPAGTRADLRACYPRFVAEYEKDVDAFFDELVAIRSPNEALIRVVDNYQSFWATLHERRTYGLVREYWQELNATIHAAAAKYGIPVAGAYEAVNGPRGEIDGVTAGWISSDQLHPSLQGASLLGEILADLGFQPAPA